MVFFWCETSIRIGRNHSGFEVGLLGPKERCSWQGSCHSKGKGVNKNHLGFWFLLLYLLVIWFHLVIWVFFNCSFGSVGFPFACLALNHFPCTDHTPMHTGEIRFNLLQMPPFCAQKTARHVTIEFNRCCFCVRGNNATTQKNPLENSEVKSHVAGSLGSERKGAILPCCEWKNAEKNGWRMRRFVAIL